MPDYSKRTNIGAILLAHNQLKGSLPSKDTLPPKLQALALAGNQFTGGQAWSSGPCCEG